VVGVSEGLQHAADHAAGHRLPPPAAALHAQVDALRLDLRRDLDGATKPEGCRGEKPLPRVTA
jgi:hypothetical protein